MFGVVDRVPLWEAANFRGNDEAQCNVYTWRCGIGFVKTAEAIELSTLGVVSGVGPENLVLDGHARGTTWQMQLNECGIRGATQPVPKLRWERSLSTFVCR